MLNMIILCCQAGLSTKETPGTGPEGEKKKIIIAVPFRERGERCVSSAQTITAMRTSATKCATTAIKCTSSSSTSLPPEYALCFKRRQTNFSPEMLCSAVLVVGKDFLN